MAGRNVCQPNYLPPTWIKPRARPNAKCRNKLWEACKRRWEGEGQAAYGPYSYDPYYNGQGSGEYDEPYAEGDYGHSYHSLRRQDRHPSPPQSSGEQGRYSVRDRVDTPGFAQGRSAGGRQDVSPQKTGLLQGVGCTRSPCSEGSRGFAC